jgi:hypothetical protein
MNSGLFVNGTFGEREKASSEKSGRERCFWVKMEPNSSGRPPPPRVPIKMESQSILTDLILEVPY